MAQRRALCRRVAGPDLALGSAQGTAVRAAAYRLRSYDHAARRLLRALHEPQRSLHRERGAGLGARLLRSRENDRRMPSEVEIAKLLQAPAHICLKRSALLVSQRLEQCALVVLELVFEVRLHRPVVLEDLLAPGRLDEARLAQLARCSPPAPDIARVRFVGAIQLVDIKLVNRFVELLAWHKRLPRVAIEPRDV